MKQWLPEGLGTAGYCLLVTGLYIQFGPGVALIVGGTLLVVAAIKMVTR